MQVMIFKPRNVDEAYVQENYIETTWLSILLIHLFLVFLQLGGQREEHIIVDSGNEVEKSLNVDKKNVCSTM